MAKSSSFFGLRTGSTKSLTFQVLRGQQITKDRVTKVSNPQSKAQMMQRALIPMVASARSELSGIVNHSWEGINYGEESLRYFSKVNLTAGALTVSSYACKNISNPGIANFIVSKGSINIPTKIITESLGNNLLGYSLTIKTSAEMKAFPKMDAGTKGSTVVYYLAKYLSQNSNDSFAKMQLSLLNMELVDRVPVTVGVGVGEQAEVLQTGFNIQRIILPDPTNISEESIEDYHDDNDVFSLQDAIAEGGSTSVILVDGEGNKISIGIQAAALTIGVNPKASCVGSALILSRLEGNIWRRSTSRFNIIANKVTPNFTFDQWFSFYDKAQVMRSEKYLNNGTDKTGLAG